MKNFSSEYQTMHKKGITYIQRKIGKIMQVMENYKIHITDLMAQLSLRTSQEVSSQREKEVPRHMESMVQSIKDIVELYDKSTQLWTSLQEDENLQALEHKEERINTTVYEMKQKQKAMKIHKNENHTRVK